MTSDLLQPLADPPLTPMALVEALLFTAPGAVTAAQLGAALDLDAAAVEAALTALQARYLAAPTAYGLRVQQHRGRYQLTSAPQAGVSVERFLGLEASGRLSRAALETLAIMAYQQPVTRPQIDAIRGVNSDGVLKSLLSKGLVQELGRAEAPGRPILYGTTADFLQSFGLNSLGELPLLEEIEAPEPPEAPPPPELLKT